MGSRSETKNRSMSAEMSNQVVAEMRESFSLLSKEGIISSKELGAVMMTLGQKPTDAELKQLISEVAPRGRGTIDFQEFLNMMAQLMNESNSTQEEIKEAFRVFDRDGSGTISNAELQRVMANLGMKLTDEEVVEMIREADGDGDGEINLPEFASMVTMKS